jgi:diguanylate cyclase (GGDEF)-like protein
MLGLVFWNERPFLQLGGWSALILLLTLFRSLLWARYHRPRVSHNVYWYRMFIGTLLAAGCLWGLGGVLFFTPEQPFELAFLVIMLAGITAGSLSALAVFTSIFVAYALPAMLPITVLCLLQGNLTLNMIGLGCLIFLGMALGYARNFQRAMIRGMQLQYQNTELVKRLEAANQQLHQFSYLDALTGIANRRQLDEHMEKVCAMAIDDETPMAMILADVDQFKAYNDQYGHDRGDQVLREVANSLKSGLRETDALVARFGGEEFSIILPNTTTEIARNVAERLRRRLEELAIPHAVGAGLRMVTASFGVAARIPSSPQCSSALLQSADQALYTAKRAGRNRVEVHDDGASAPLAAASRTR